MDCCHTRLAATRFLEQAGLTPAVDVAEGRLVVYVSGYSAATATAAVGAAGASVDAAPPAAFRGWRDLRPALEPIASGQPTEATPAAASPSS